MLKSEKNQVSAVIRELLFAVAENYRQIRLSSLSPPPPHLLAQFGRFAKSAIIPLKDRPNLSFLFIGVMDVSPDGFYVLLIHLSFFYPDGFSFMS